MTEKYKSIPPGVEAVSCRMAAEILGCSMGHIRHLAGTGRLGKVYKVSSRALMLDKAFIKKYQKSLKPQGRPRAGFSIDT
jgi:hypothetical protein